MQGVVHTAADAENWLSVLLDRLQRRFEGLVNAEYDVAAGDHDNMELHVSPRVDERLKCYKQQVKATQNSKLSTHSCNSAWQMVLCLTRHSLVKLQFLHN